MKKNVAVFTSIRSEYGLLKPLLSRIQESHHLNLLLLVGGAHLSKDYGHSVDQIIADGFKIEKEFDFLGEHPIESLGKLQRLMGDYLINNKPDLLLILGDRFELMPLATSCVLLNIPIAHVSGGDITEGAQDNQFRHALTKLSHIHFPATEEYKENLRCMGEEEWRICVSGEPGLDQLSNFPFYTKDDLYKELGFDPKSRYVISTFHPETITNKINSDFVSAFIQNFIKETNDYLLITASNFDEGGKEINDAIEYISKNNDRIVYYKSLGQKRYYSALKYADLMVGNSSSGLVEAQSFNLPVINVGDRQKGRLANPNVLHCPADVDVIIASIEKAKSESFKSKYLDKKNIYGDGKACDRIIDYLEQLDFKKLLEKRTDFKK